MMGIVLKLSAKSKYDTLVLGGSTTESFINEDNVTTKQAFISYGMLPREVLSNYVNFFIELHPELKTVIFPIEYTSYYFNYKNEFPIIKSKYLSMKEFARLFLSYETTKLSIKKLIEKPKLVFDKNRYKKKEDIDSPFTEKEMTRMIDALDTITTFETFDLGISSIKTNKKDFDYNFKYNVFINRNYSNYIKNNQTNIINDLNQYIELFQKKNFNVVYIIPAYHAIMQSKIYKQFNYKDIETIKKFLVNKTGKSIIDFAYINKYTTEDINKTYLYYDINHPFSYKYNLFFCAIDNLEKYKDKDVYVKLTKDNIEEVLFEQRKRLEKYIRENNPYIESFLNEKNKDSDTKTIQKSTKDAPLCSQY